MEMSELVEAVGRDRFRSACDLAWRTAANTGSQPVPASWPPDLAYVPHDLADVWSDTRFPLLERLRVAQQLYRHMPCYGLLMYVKHAFDDFGSDESEVFWAEYRLLLEHEDERLADPVAYSLWVDFFEDRSTVERAWQACIDRIDDGAVTRRVERVLSVSGPVPYSLKGEVYVRLAADRRWHEHIARGLVGSTFDVYGDVDWAAAYALLARLEVSDDAPGVTQLRQRLADETARGRRRSRKADRAGG